MANNTLAVTQLDFQGNVDNLKAFLRNYPQFKDYDFEGSNLATLIDLLGYNTYMNSFYTNMVLNEMFLDTAVIRDSVVSHAKELNYLPRSMRSAEAKINITIYPDDNPGYIVIPSGTRFNGTNGQKVMGFMTDKDVVVSPINNVYGVSNVSIYEGITVAEVYNVNTSIESQRFVLSNPNIDTTSLTVNVTNPAGLNEEWKFSPTLLDVKTDSKVYFLQASSNKYEIIFGAGVVGAAPPNGSQVTATYRVTNGEAGNGIRSFKASAAIGGYTQFAVSAATDKNGYPIASSGGSAVETTKSIRLNAPRSFQTLERAVTADDYKNILFAQFPEIADVFVYGGDELSPPDYGKVYIAVELKNTQGLSDLEKNKIQSFISTRAPISIATFVTPAEYTRIAIESNVNYNLNSSSLSESDVQAKIIAAIQTYNDQNLNKFNARFRFSKLLTAIDSADTSIVDNQTTLQMIKEFTPNLNVDYSSSFDYQNEIQPGTISSTAFTYNGLQCSIIDDGSGNIVIISTTNGIVTTIATLGVVNYTDGIISIVNLNVSAYVGNYIALYAGPANFDFSSSKNTVLDIDFENVTVNVTGIRV